jgi:UDP-glucose 4-epimerase
VAGYDGIPVAVLGASGFIGRCVVRKLAEQGARILPVGRQDLASLETLYRRLRPTITFNLAGYGVDPAQREESEAFHVNAELPRALAGAVAATRDARWRGQHLIHAGSAAEYGNTGGSLREDGPASPGTLYGISKCRGTEAVIERCQALGVRGIVARLFTVYGPGERPGRLLPSLAGAARTGQPISLSAGLQRRDFTYIENVAEGLLRLGLAPGEGARIVNLATGKLTTVRAFVEIAAQILGISPENLRFGEIPPTIHEMEHDAVSMERLQRLIGWIPEVSIAEGVRKSMETGLL